MSRGQFFTAFTMGFATAIAVLGIASGIALLVWPRPAWMIGNRLGVSPTTVALMVSSASLLVGCGMVSIQQSIARWSANRANRPLNRDHQALK